MMKIEIDLNDVQKCVSELAKRHGLSDIEIEEELKLSYRNPLQEKFENRLSMLLEAMQLHKVATANNDPHAAVAGIVEAKVAASLLSDDFGALEADLVAAIRLANTRLPEGYTVPEHYRYSKK